MSQYKKLAGQVNYLSENQVKAYLAGCKAIGMSDEQAEVRLLALDARKHADWVKHKSEYAMDRYHGPGGDVY